jgi:hypothetical protein
VFLPVRLFPQSGRARCVVPVVTWRFGTGIRQIPFINQENQRKGSVGLHVPTKEDPAPQSCVQNRTVGLTKATDSGCQVPATTLRKDKPPQKTVQVEVSGLDLQASEGPRVLNALPFQGEGSCSARLFEVRGALASVALGYVMRRILHERQDGDGGAVAAIATSMQTIGPWRGK